MYGLGTVAVGIKRLVQSGWGGICFDLFMELRTWIHGKIKEKAALLRRGIGLASLHSQREEHYSAVLKYFDEAIDALGAHTRKDAPKTSTFTLGPLSHPTEADVLPTRRLRNRPLAVVPVVDSLLAPAATARSHGALRTSVQLEDSSTPVEPRRSARIRNIRLCKGGHASSIPSSALHQPTASVHTNEVRRSARIAKRRREDDEPPRSLPSKRIKTGQLKRSRRGPRS